MGGAYRAYEGGEEGMQEFGGKAGRKETVRKTEDNIKIPVP
jgi:hypothetical protein